MKERTLLHQKIIAIHFRIKGVRPRAKQGTEFPSTEKSDLPMPAKVPERINLP